MTAASQEQTWPQANSQHDLLGRTGFRFVEDQYSYRVNRAQFDDLDSASNSSSAIYSLSDISLSSSSSGSEAKGASVPRSDVSHTSPDLTFLPPSKACHDKFAEVPPRCNDTESSSMYSPDCGSLKSDLFSCNEKSYEVGNSPVLQPNSSHSQSMSGDLIFEFDVVGMREKLEAQKEYLLGTFQKPIRLPQVLTTLPRYPRVEKVCQRSLSLSLFACVRVTVCVCSRE